MLTKPLLTQERIDEIRSIIAENPGMGRTQISKQLCAQWEWMSPSGQLKDVAARDMLRALDKAGKIKLPPAKIITHIPGQQGKIKRLEHKMDPVK
jgi:cysteine synthase